MNKAIESAKRFWSSLPPKVQAGAVIVAAAAGASLGKAFSDPASCWQAKCLKHYVGAAIGAGLVAGRAFYMRPGPGRVGGPPYEGS